MLFLIVLSVEVRRKEKSNPVKAVGVEHSAYKSDCAERKLLRLDMCGFRKLTVLCHGGSICEKVSTAAVCDTVDVAGIAIVFDKVCIDILKSIADIRKLVKYHTVGYEAVFDAEHKIAEPAELSTEEAVKFLAANQKSTAVYVYHNRQGGVLTPLGAVYVHAVSLIAVIHVRNICLHTYALRHNLRLVALYC